jgi:hypothetical protein
MLVGVLGEQRLDRCQLLGREGPVPATPRRYANLLAHVVAGLESPPIDAPGGMR